MTEGGRYATTDESKKKNSNPVYRYCRHATCVSSIQGHCMDMSPHSVICPAVGSVRRCLCPPTLPWLSDPQRGYTLGTCRKTQAQSSSNTTHTKC